MPNKKTKKEIDTELKKSEFRVTIFGSARLKKSDKIYKQVYNLAKEIGKHSFDLVTGGGPGLMEAANAGHKEGDIKHKADSIGLTIELPSGSKENVYLEIEKHFQRFSSRLDHFMTLSSVVVIVPGGIGTCLEFFYTWQLIQVKHICPIPVILVGKMWETLIDWVKKYPLRNKLMSKIDLKNIYIAKNNTEAIKIILNTYEAFKKEGKNYCKNITRYKLK